MVTSSPSESRATPSLEAAGTLPLVAAIVVSYNSALDLPAALRALQSQRGVRLEIHVVDNASRDESVALVRRDFPDVRVVANDRNVGFAMANNQVLEGSSAPFVALVNPDTIADPGAVAACVDYLTRNPGAGVAAPRLLHPDVSLQPSCYSFLSLRNLLGETLGAHRLFPGWRTLSSLHMPWFEHDRVAEVDWVTGAFLVVRREAVQAAGPLDPAFFMYGEEMDWCYRMRRAGWRTVFLPEPSVVHVRGASSAPVAGPMFVENLKGRIRFLRKHRGPWVATAARALIALSVFLRWPGKEVAALGRGGGAVARRQSRTMFRSAAAWVLRGLPLSPHVPRDP
jgi:GT2 family glycosyltransferase